MGFLSHTDPFLNNIVIGVGWFGSVYSFRGSLYFFNLKIYGSLTGGVAKRVEQLLCK
jgi:hypothetical protein